MGLRAGLLRHTVTFMTPTITRDAFGEQATEWVDVLSTRARVVYGGGSRRVANNEELNAYNVTFTVRSYHSINDQMRIKFNGRVYAIESLNIDAIAQQAVIITSVVNE